MKRCARKRAGLFREGRRKPGPESNIQSSIRDYLQKLGIWCERHNVHEGFMRNGGYIKCGQKGESDLLALVRKPDGGHWVWRIETKAPKKTQRPDQKLFAILAQQDGQFYDVARSIDDLAPRLREFRVLR